MITIYVDSKLTILGLSEKWRTGLSDFASVKNESKDRALKEFVWGASNLPDKVSLAEINGSTISLPRGARNKLSETLTKSGHEAIFKEQFPAHKSIDIPRAPKLRPKQKEAVSAILKYKSGRIIMPTGEGKTVVALGTIYRLKKPALILVDKKHIAKQWMDRGWQHIGYTPGLIGDNIWNEKPISVALFQTLSSRFDDIDPEWWSRWSIVIHDEQHHIPADTYCKIVQMFPGEYRIGLSATIGKSETKKEISELVFGPIIYESKEKKIKPLIKVVDTSFNFPYRPTEKKGRKVIRNNWHDLVAALIEDQNRNLLIARNIENSAANLIVSRRLNHLRLIRNLVLDSGFPEERCWMLTGKESTEERMKIYEMADAGSCAIFSTIADEALDIPRLDRLHLIFPQRNVETIKQQIGRLTRPHEDKEDCLVLDYVDSKIGIIKNQFSERLRNLYQRESLTVYRINT